MKAAPEAVIRLFSNLVRAGGKPYVPLAAQ